MQEASQVSDSMEPSESGFKGQEVMAERMRKETKRELPPLTLTYINAKGVPSQGSFSQAEIQKCEVCDRNQPLEFMSQHMAYKHGAFA